VELVPNHTYQPDVSFDGGDLDCGNGLLLLIRRHIDPMYPGQVLEILSNEVSVEEDLPAWCRLTSNRLLSWTRNGTRRSFLLCKGQNVASSSAPKLGQAQSAPRLERIEVKAPSQLPDPIPALPIPELAVSGIGSWPRPRWMLQAVHERMEGRLSEDDFQATANDAVRLVVEAQLRSGATIITDGEQRRDSYASFVGSRLDNCQLIPLSDLSAMVDEPEKFQAELRALDVPADQVRHPVVYGPLGRTQPLAVHELEFLKRLTDKPIKIALPGPYLLTRTMWLDCLSDRYYQDRETLATDIARVLREEAHHLLAQGASLVQFDEPVLTEVVFSGPKNTRSFMCGALSERGEASHELGFARELLQEVTRGLPADRLALHLCRGNWTQDEAALLRGDYQPLLDYLTTIPVGTLFLEFATERAGSLQLVKHIPENYRVGIGLVNPKRISIETVEEILPKAQEAYQLLGSARMLLTPDCGFATFADNPVTSQSAAEGKLRTLSECARQLGFIA
jgi:5-methyltetrahydropteroyltriglutamate--homocysteine methyltransferase